MAKNYTNYQLRVIQDLIFENGHLYYHMGARLETEYAIRSDGDHRSSGALYMVGWRMENGYYAHRGFIA